MVKALISVKSLSAAIKSHGFPNPYQYWIIFYDISRDYIFFPWLKTSSLIICIEIEEKKVL